MLSIRKGKGIKMPKKLILILSFLLFAACTMPETRIYSLSLPVEKKTNSAKDVSINILVRSPRYLSQPYIAYRLSPYQLEISKYAKWDSTPVEMVKEALKDALSTMFREVRVSSLSSGSYSIDINLRRFEKVNGEGDPAGELVFDVNLFAPDGKEIYRNTISKKVKLDDLNNLSLAKGLSSALADGIEEVKTAIAGLIKPV